VAAPVQRGEELDLSIESLAFGGNGVARLDGFVVFVRRGLPGDRVRAHVLKTQRRHAEAVVVEVLEPGPVRVEAPCKHYPVCGGCRFQDLAYETQLEAKHSWVRDSLERIAGIQNPPLEPIVRAEEIYGYRNKMEYSFAPGEDGGDIQLGFHAAGRWDTVLQIDECLLTSDLGNNLRNAVRAWAIEDKLSAYDQREHKGYLRHLMLREGRNTGEMLVQLVTNKGERFDRERFIEVVTQFPEVKSVHWSVNEAPSENTNLPTELLWGADAIEEEIGGLRFRVRPNAFLQTNTKMAATLYDLAIEAAGLTGKETVYDLYCGIGTIGLALAKNALTVWGIEISEEAVACAIENAELNSIGNAAFFAGNVGLVLEELRERSGEPDVVVVDPPRAGLAGKALKRLGELGAQRVVYVSCNPTTFAGDLKRLNEEYGYDLIRTTPVDMFPHTPHVEAVSLLERRAGFVLPEPEPKKPKKR
jgi:23S rRNA (uracil1939-C5)-methyltransferase